MNYKYITDSKTQCVNVLKNFQIEIRKHSFKNVCTSHNRHYTLLKLLKLQKSISKLFKCRKYKNIT